MFIVCVCVPVKIQFNNTSTCNYPLARSLCSLAQLPPHPYSNILDPPLNNVQ